MAWKAHFQITCSSKPGMQVTCSYMQLHTCVKVCKFNFLLIIIIKILKSHYLPAVKETAAKTDYVPCSNSHSAVHLNQEGQKSVSTTVCLKMSKSSSEVLGRAQSGHCSSAHTRARTWWRYPRQQPGWSATGGWHKRVFWSSVKSELILNISFA